MDAVLLYECDNSGPGPDLVCSDTPAVTADSDGEPGVDSVFVAR